MPHTRTMKLAQVNDIVTGVVAFAAASGPLWFENLADISAYAATVTPIVGLIWLVLQILGKLTEWHAKYLAWKLVREKDKWIREQQKRQRVKDKEIEDESDRRSEVDRRSKEVSRAEGDSWPEQ